MTNLNYMKAGDYSIPNLRLSETPEIGKYGRMRRNYLKEHRPILYNRLLLTEKLYPHLADIDQTANRRLGQLMDEMMTIKRSDGGAESDRYDEVDGADEQSEISGGGNDSERADLQLKPTRGEQISLLSRVILDQRTNKLNQLNERKLRRFPLFRLQGRFSRQFCVIQSLRMNG